MSDGDALPDPEELAQCFECHAETLFAYAVFLTRGDQPLAEDLVEQSFLAAFEDWNTLRNRTQLQRRGWLLQVLHNIAVSEFRRGGLARRKRPQVAEYYRPVEADTSRDALFKIALERCWQVIDCMPEKRHLVAMMHWRDGMKTGEIAAVLGIASGTVHAHLHAARLQLKSELGPYYPFGENEAEGGSAS